MLLSIIKTGFKRCYSNTIYALSSGQGKCGVAVIRISGKNTEKALKSITNLKALPKPRQAILRSIHHPKTDNILDKGLIIWFPGPKSFTGEDCCELHVHGGLAVISAVLEALSSIKGLRIAEPGEFTRRAFYNGKLDLTEVEGLADLLQAETEAQRKQAFYQSQGSLSKLYNEWRKQLIQSVAHIEAHIDFEETETIDDNILSTVGDNIRKLAQQIRKHLNDGRKGEILRRGARSVILGETNVGKSSLLNVLCQRQAAIVTPIEGTTRDLLEVTYNIRDYPLILTDTAGLREKTEDLIELEGMKRALNVYKEADLVILVIDSLKYFKWLQINTGNFNKYLEFYIKTLNINDLITFNPDGLKFHKNCIIVLNKIDLINPEMIVPKSNDLQSISCILHEGIEQLIDKIGDKLKIICGEPKHEQPSMNQVRHRENLTKCLEYLDKYLNENTKNCDTVLMAEYLRKSLKYLGKLVGVVTNEELLDVIFKDFCIGK